MFDAIPPALADELAVLDSILKGQFPFTANERNDGHFKYSSDDNFYARKFLEQATALLVKSNGDRATFEMVFYHIETIVGQNGYDSILKDLHELKEIAWIGHLPLDNLRGSNERPLTQPHAMHRIAIKNVVITSLKIGLLKIWIFINHNFISALVCGVVILFLGLYITEHDKLMRFLGLFGLK